ncbi:MAG: Zn-dependent oligopeptidase [Acidimicrobiia bacterium]|nr:Zn-dependent oligopeptidase [Acidimicrobiia bacterium]
MLHDYTSTTAADVARVTGEAIGRANAIIDDIVAVDGERTIANTLLPLNEAAATIMEGYGQGAFMARVHPDASVRLAATEEEEKLNKWGIDVVFRPDLYAALSSFEGTSPDMTPEQARLLEFWMRDFRRAGHELEEAEQAELKQLKQRLVELEVAFAANVDAYTDYIEVTREELDGLPDSFIEALKPGDRDGTYRVTLDYPDLYPFLQNATNRAKREELFRKKHTSVVPENRPLLEEALTLRRRIAALIGYESWAHHSMDVKMADPDRVERFYDDLVPRLKEKVRSEHDKMRRMLLDEYGTDDLHQWDVSYYSTRIRREEYGIDPYAVAEYFPLEAVVDGMLDITAEMFGLTYSRVEPTGAWHPDVYLFEIKNAADGQHLAYFYMDLFPREGKFGHAAAFDLVAGHTNLDGEDIRPVAAMVANFTKPTAGTPSLLRHDEVLTLFHEFGHILHQTVTRAETVRFSGANTEWDFVEAPSQIMEHWTWEPEVLGRFSRHYQTGEPLPENIVASLVAARDVNIAASNLRQAYFGILDLLLHDASDDRDLDALDREAYEVNELPFPEGTFFLASFGHVMGGYDAGYYGYLWSRVFGDDMYSRFQEDGVLDPQVGRDYRRVILEQGGTKDADDLLREFLGREPNNQAFLRNLGL